MTTKGKISRLESEISKCRTIGNWTKILDIVRQSTNKPISRDDDGLLILVLGEAKLEKYLQDNPQGDNLPQNKQVLSEAHKHFQDCLKSNPNPGIKSETLLLLSKLYYIEGKYSDALKTLDENLKLETLPLTNISNRRLKIIAEAFAIKGLCLEKQTLSSTSKFKLVEHEEHIISCFEKAGDYSFVQLQDLQEAGKGTPTSASLQAAGIWSYTEFDMIELSQLVETAVQRSPLYYISKGQLSNGIDRFRTLIRNVETHAVRGLRQILARQLAEVLLRGVCEGTYSKIPYIDDPLNANQITKEVMLPRMYSGKNLFIPCNQTEEILLLLLISESMTSKDTVLNRSPEFTDVRKNMFMNATAVYDLLTITLVRHSHYAMLNETFERAMKFSFDEIHLWYQFALTLICSSRYSRALLVLQECMKMAPNNLTVYLLSTKICFEHLHRIDEGISYAKAMTNCDSLSPYTARAHVVLGIGYALKANQSKKENERKQFQSDALKEFYFASDIDSSDYLAQFHIALLLAFSREIPKALAHVRKALELKCDHIHSLHLLALLLSTCKQYTEALDVIDTACFEYPGNFNIITTRCHLIEIVHNTDEALSICKDMLKQWKEVHDNSVDCEHRGTGLIDRVTADSRSLMHLHLTDLSEDSGSVRADSIAASKIEQALSEVASSFTSIHLKDSSDHMWSMQAQIWLLTAQQFITLNHIEEAKACIAEATAISAPVSYMVSYTKGCLYEKMNEFQEAEQYFQNALSIQPDHVKSLQKLGIILYHLENYKSAEKILRNAVKIDPLSSKSWQFLGITQHALCDFESGASCLSTSLNLEYTSPIRSFNVIPHSFE